jgi:hypothetical protein
MFGWLARFHRRAMERHVERALARAKAMRAQWRAEHGDEPFPLMGDLRRQVRAKRDQMSPEARRMIDEDDFFGLDEER